MITVVIAGDGSYFKVMALDPESKEIHDVTDQYTVRAVEYVAEDGRTMVGFHVGFPKEE